MYSIGLDVGTTCTKALLLEEGGQILAVRSNGYPLLGKGNHVEQRAQDWITASVQAIRGILEGIDPAQVGAISLSTQGGSMVMVDANGDLIGNAITWMDGRAQTQAREIEEELGGDYVYRTTGWRISPSFDAAKIRYLKKTGEASCAKKYLTTIEVINAYLTGTPVIDPSNAAMRQLYNIQRGCWDEMLLQAAGVKEAELPKIQVTGICIGNLCPEAAAALGLTERVRVYLGAHDQYCASIGSGVVGEGELLLSAGTTWVLMGVGRTPLFTESYIAPGRHPVEGLYGAIASLVGSGASLQWFKNEFMPEEFDEMNRVAAGRRDRAQGLFFYPYVSGAGYPEWKPDARGTFTGLSLEHDRFDLARAIMEGAAFGVRRGVCDFEANGCPVRQITIMGGAAKSDLWCQMIASVTHKQVQRLKQPDACAVGAAMIAACGQGIYADYKEAARTVVRIAGVCEPQREDVIFYDEKYEEYLRFLSCMKEYYR